MVLNPPNTGAAGVVSDVLDFVDLVASLFAAAGTAEKLKAGVAVAVVFVDEEINATQTNI